MKLQEYQQATQRTMPDLGSIELNIAHMIMGMNSEFNELYDATDDVNRGEELTDYNWYLNNYATLRGVDIWRITEFHPSDYYKLLKKDDYIEQLQVSVSKLTDLEKKHLAYKREITQLQIIDAIVDVAERLNDCYVYFNLNAEDCMQKNIDKLKARFPEKFAEGYDWRHDANNRDLEKERKILEGK
jgi:hypothetical protein